MVLVYLAFGWVKRTFYTSEMRKMSYTQLDLRKVSHGVGFFCVALAGVLGVTIDGVNAGSVDLIGSGSCVQQVESAADVTVSEILVGGQPYCVVEFRGVGDNTWHIPNGVNSIEYLVVAGGGAGGYAWDSASAGGGGAGGYLEGSVCLVGRDLLSVTVGAGGVGGDGGGSSTGVDGGDGSNSSLGSVVSIGGGGGATARAPGRDGGSGGGAGGRFSNSRTGGLGTSGQGFGGGWSNQPSGAGGGGASSEGALAPSGSPPVGGVGGAGRISTITGTPLTLAVGGNGGGRSPGVGSGAAQATGNGGDGGSATGTPVAGILNFAGGNGGSGIVVLRYANNESVHRNACRIHLDVPDLEDYAERVQEVVGLPDTR